MRFSREVPMGDIYRFDVITDCLTDEQLQRAHEFLAGNLQSVKHEQIIVVVARVGATMAAWLLEQKAKERAAAPDTLDDELGRD